jgi:branched-chain amino acid transport system ATP-binding protein
VLPPGPETEVAAALLELQHVTKRFGGLVANQDVTFDIGAGEIVGLIGPNGAGKTTLFNCIAGFHVASEGEILFRGHSLIGLAPEQVAARGIARTFQIVRIFRSLTVLENVMVGAMLHKRSVAAAREKAHATLAFVGLDALAGRLASEITVSEQKRLEVARGLALDPELIILDEVMAGMNASEMKLAMELVQRIRDRGIACIIVEHVMEGIMPIADRMVVLDYGRKIAEGTPAQIAADPAVIAAYLGA